MDEQRRHKKTAENEQVIQSGLHTHTKSKTRNKVTEVNMKTRIDTGR